MLRKMRSVIASYLLALGCVVGLAVGQLLFKFAANALQQGLPTTHPKVLSSLGAAFFLYGLTSLLWVWILKEIELARIYPLMALSFVLVPFGASLFFGEALAGRYFLGIALIVAGIVVTTSS